MAAVILAAGAGSRFGGGKVRAALDGRPLVAHVLGAVRDAGIRRVVVVLGRDAGAVLGAVRAIEPSALDGVLVTINPAPERGLATSLRLGFGPGAAPPVPAGVLFLLADQPRVRASVVRELCAARVPAGTIAVAPSYSGDAAPNPVLLLPGGWPLVAGAAGDRGLGPLLTADPARVVRVAVSGTNPDVDTPGDLAALAGPGASHAAPAASHAAPGASHAAPAAGPPALGPTGPSNRTPHSTEEAQ
jgi:CTP:molybdopterin cytidylyltransferase MocA